MAYGSLRFCFCLGDAAKFLAEVVLSLIESEFADTQFDFWSEYYI
jgi:hypothetical protein